jgi:hypothetical protein
LKTRLACASCTSSATPARYERAAVRWLERLIAENHPSLEDVGLAVGALAEVRNGHGAACMFTLKRLVRK